MDIRQRGTLLAVVALWLARSSPAQPTEEDVPFCGEGHWDAVSESCVCNSGWRQAGITDTFHFLEKSCTQFSCQGDSHCQELLGIPDASCPIESWNCYCGWRYAFSASFSGFQSKDGAAKCMGVMYTFAMFMTGLLEVALTRMWALFVGVAVLLLPVGKKRMVCDHHRATLWSSLRLTMRPHGSCQNGECVSERDYSMMRFMDDFAWSLYALDLMVWTYTLCIVVYLNVLLIWSIALWMLVIVMLLVACVAVCCMAIASCGGELSCGHCHCGDCGNCGDCTCCGDVFQPVDATGVDAMYWGGPHPSDPFWGSWGSGGFDVNSGGICDCGGCCSRRRSCLPVAWVIYTCPIMPENAWGGFVGYWMGTHVATPNERAYLGGNAWIDFLGFHWRRRADLHDDDDWRTRVYNFLAASPQPLEQRVSSMTGRGHGTAMPLNSLRIGAAHVKVISRPFDLERDRCFESSFDDYCHNLCWICQQGNAQYDMWMSCRHIFCASCSATMLERGMPCPLCRMASSSVLRGERLCKAQKV